MAEPAAKISGKKNTRLLQLATSQEGFATSFDKTRISFHSSGDESPPIICCNGLGVSTFFWIYLQQHFRFSNQVVTWDYRGHGRSELKRNRKNYKIESLVKDLTAVLDVLKIKKAIFLGHSIGTQVILEFYRKHPKRVAGLIPCFGTYGRLMDTFYNFSFSPLVFRLVYFLGTQFPKQGNLISRLLLANPLSYWVGGILKVANTGMVSRKDVQRYVDHVLSVDPRLFTSLLKSAQEHNAEGFLPKIQVPTLIIAGDEDQFTPAWTSKKMHRLIPNSELFMIHKATHAGLVEQPDLINLRVEKFLNERILKKKR